MAPWNPTHTNYWPVFYNVNGHDNKNTNHWNHYFLHHFGPVYKFVHECTQYTSQSLRELGIHTNKVIEMVTNLTLVYYFLMTSNFQDNQMSLYAFDKDKFAHNKYFNLLASANVSTSIV